MRILFTVMIIMLGCNLAVELMDSNMLEILEKRRETIEAVTNTN